MHRSPLSLRFCFITFHSLVGCFSLRPPFTRSLLSFRYGRGTEAYVAFEGADLDTFAKEGMVGFRYLSVVRETRWQRYLT